MGKLPMCLWTVGGILMLLGWSLFFRMAIKLNRVLQPAKRIPLIEFRNYRLEIERLYEDSFPESELPTGFRVLIVAGALTIGAGVILALARTSKGPI